MYKNKSFYCITCTGTTGHCVSTGYIYIYIVRRIRLKQISTGKLKIQHMEKISDKNTKRFGFFVDLNQLGF
jgi:hypothetical protein